MGKAAIIGVLTLWCVAFVRAGEAEVGAGHAVTFPVAQTVVWAHRVQVLPFEVASSSSSDRTYPVTIAPADRGAVEGRATVLAGYRIGYVTLRDLQPGRATLRVGEAELRLDVRPQRDDTTAAQAGIRFIGPVDGTAVWGEVTVGIELSRVAAEHEVLIQAPAGAVITAEPTPVRDTVPARWLADIDFSSVRAGTHTLTAESVDPSGKTVSRAQVRLQVLGPEQDLALRFEAEQPPSGDVPERYEGQGSSIGKSQEASGGAFVRNNGSSGPPMLTMRVDEPGHYQFIARAAGDAGGGALPSIGVRLNNEGQPRSAGRLLRSGWHRAAIGRPVYLEAGTHTIAAFFENDFYVPGATDRNLRTDVLELARVAEVKAVASASPRTIDPLGDPAALLATRRTLNGRTLAGDQWVEARLSVIGRDDVAGVPVTLMLNGQPLATR